MWQLHEIHLIWTHKRHLISHSHRQTVVCISWVVEWVIRMIYTGVGVGLLYTYYSHRIRLSFNELSKTCEQKSGLITPWKKMKYFHSNCNSNYENYFHSHCNSNDENSFETENDWVTMTLTLPELKRLSWYEICESSVKFHGRCYSMATYGIIIRQRIFSYILVERIYRGSLWYKVIVITLPVT